MAILPIKKFKECYTPDEYKQLFRPLSEVAPGFSIQLSDGYVYDPIWPPMGWILPVDHRLYKDRSTGARIHIPIVAIVHPLDECESYEKNKFLAERIKANLWRSAR